eukprot:scaffold11245_cov90-Phaeocystis_antarctica.AAC.3
MRQPPVRGRLELHRGGRVLVLKDARSVTSAQHDGRTAAPHSSPSGPDAPPACVAQPGANNCASPRGPA